MKILRGMSANGGEATWNRMPFRRIEGRGCRGSGWEIQAPNPKHQALEKHQAPKSQKQLGAWSLVLRSLHYGRTSRKAANTESIDTDSMHRISSLSLP